MRKPSDAQLPKKYLCLVQLRTKVLGLASVVGHAHVFKAMHARKTAHGIFSIIYHHLGWRSSLIEEEQLFAAEGPLVYRAVDALHDGAH